MDRRLGELLPGDLPPGKSQPGKSQPGKSQPGELQPGEPQPGEPSPELRGPVLSAAPAGPAWALEPSRKTKFQAARQLAQASAIGLSAVTAIVLGLALGLWLDGRLGTKPWLTLGGLLLGVVAGLRNIFILAARVERDEKADHDPQPR